MTPTIQFITMTQASFKQNKLKSRTLEYEALMSPKKNCKIDGLARSEEWDLMQSRNSQPL